MVVLRSHDGGKTWDTVLTGGDLHSIVTDTKQPNTVYVASAQGAQRSDDAGTTWREIDSGLRDGCVGLNTPAELLTNPGQPGTLFTTADCAEVFVTTTRGE